MRRSVSGIDQRDRNGSRHAVDINAG